MTKLSRAEMIALVDKIVLCQGTEKEVNDAIALFDANCLHPSKNSLIFWPHGVPHDRSKPEPTAAEIVDKALTPGTVICL
jgi:Colicin immunity protein / pyocin immunity protein